MKPEIAGGKNDQIEADWLQAHHEKEGLFEKENSAGKNRRQLGIK